MVIEELEALRDHIEKLRKSYEETSYDIGKHNNTLAMSYISKASALVDIELFISNRILILLNKRLEEQGAGE